jgi:hypothetical protein
MPRAKALDPDAQIAALDAKRVDLAKRRHELDAIDKRQRRIVDEAPERRRAAFIAEARGEEPSEPVEQIDRERRQAEVEIAGGRERIEAVRTVERECKEQEHAIRDANRAHFRAKAVAASEAADQAWTTLIGEVQSLVSLCREAAALHGEDRRSCIRSGVSVPPEVPTSDFGDVIGALSKSSRPWPAGSRAAWERYLARESSEAARTPTNREARAWVEAVP